MEKKKKKQPRKITPTYLENSAIYYLERFSSSTDNLRRVMTRKIMKSCYFYQEDDIEEKKEWLEVVIAKLVRIGYLNDETYTNMKARSLRYSGNSKRNIMGKLKQKGLSEEMINKSLSKADEDLFDGEDGEIEAAKHYAKKKRFGQYRTKSEEENTKQKELASMARAGFSYDIAKKILEESK
jgi:regulatory protein